MGFSFSLSASATIVSTASVNGENKGWAYRRESYANNNGSGVRTTRQNLGQQPVQQTRLYDAQGRPMLADGSGQQERRRDGVQRRNPRPARPRNYTKIISIEDITDEQEGEAPINMQDSEEKK